MSKRTATEDREPKRFKFENSGKPGTSKGTQIETPQTEKSEKIFDPKQTSNSEKPNNSGKIGNSERLERPKPLTSYSTLDSSKVATVHPYVAREPEVIARHYCFYENSSYRNYERIVSQNSQSLDSDDDLYDGMWI